MDKATEGCAPAVIRRTVMAVTLAPARATDEVTLVYDPGYPLAVTVDFGEDRYGNEICWTFSRDLLRDGLKDHAGIGDVRCWSVGLSLLIGLTSDDGGWMVMAITRREIKEFVSAMYKAVPVSKECHLLGLTQSAIRRFIEEDREET